MKRNIFFTIVTAVVSLLLLAGCSHRGSNSDNSSRQHVKIGYLPITHAVSLFAAKDFIDADTTCKFDIELVKFGNWTDLTDALNSGRIDGASVLVELAMAAKSKGIGLKAIALGHKDGNVVVVGNGINSVADLKGKKFAIPNTQSSHNILLNQMLHDNGMSINDLQVIQLAPPEMPYSLSNGSIDGYCVAEPFGAMSVSKRLGKVLYTSEQLWPNSVCCALVLTDAFINANAAIVERLRDVYHDVNAHNGKQEVSSLSKKYLGQPDDVLATSLQWIHYDSLHITRSDYDLLVQKVKDFGISTNPPSYDDFVFDK